MADLQVPSYFICPISLEIMKDPVTLSTGITYDRDCIEKWLFSQKNRVCPVTKQAVLDIELTPNLTLCRLIQSWCTLNNSSGVQTFPNPQLPITSTEIIELLKDTKSPHRQIKSLKRLKTIVLENERNKLLLKSVGAVDYLVFVLTKVNNSMASSSPTRGFTGADEALTILYNLDLSPTDIKSLFQNSTRDIIDALTSMMQRVTSFESRATALILLKSMFEVVEPMHVTSLNPKFFTELVQIMIDQISPKAALELLINVCSWSRNRIKAAEAGAVAVLVDILLNYPEKRVSEMVIIALDQICMCAEGRAELVKHAGGVAVVSKNIFRVSSVASESAVKILHSVAKFSGDSRCVVQEMLELGVVGKLCLVMDVDCGKKMKEKAREILKMHSRVWKNSSCIS